MEEQLISIFQQTGNGKGSVISFLQSAQRKIGYISLEAVQLISRQVGISVSEIYGVASFYSQFKFSPPARHDCKVCVGTACHVRGSQKILEACERSLNVESGGITSDRSYGLDKVACFGSCALAPVMSVDGEVYGRLTPDRVREVLSKHT